MTGMLPQLWRGRSALLLGNSRVLGAYPVDHLFTGDTDRMQMPLPFRGCHAAMEQEIVIRNDCVVQSI